MSATSEPSTQQPAKRLGGATGRGWLPGRSGNAGGRPRAALNVQELARQHTEQAVRALVEALRDPKLKVAAATALLDRGWGRPIQPLQSENRTAVLHLVAAQQASRELIAELKPTPAPMDPQPNVDLAALPLPTE
jgi:hypothetical protein